MRYPKSIIKAAIQALGFDVRRLNPRTNATYQLLVALDRFDVDLVLDVGANSGRFAAELRAMGYKGSIVSFEPLRSAHEQLTRNAVPDPRWHVHPRGAVGDKDGQVEIHVAGNSVSSSILPMLEAHRSAVQESAYVGTETVPIFTLDSVAEAYLNDSRSPFLKVDTQGFEWQVLDGAKTILPGIVGILCELSLVPLYEGNRLWMEMIQRLEGEGFTLWSIQKGFTDHRDGRTLQLDAVFFRTD